jgi:hypothetical protein
MQFARFRSTDYLIAILTAVNALQCLVDAVTGDLHSVRVWRRESREASSSRLVVPVFNMAR